MADNLAVPRMQAWNVNAPNSGLPGGPWIHWVVSYPKSGNTWVRQLLSVYASQMGDVRCRFGDSQRYWTQAVSPHPLMAMTHRDIAQVRGAAMYHMMAQMDGVNVCKSHHAFLTVEGVPMWARPWVNRVIYVARDPRDIVASWRAHNGHGTMEETIDMMANPTTVLRHANGGAAPQFVMSWSYHVASWLGNPLEPPLLVRYRDLHADTAGSLRRILTHLGLEPDDGRIAMAVERCEFARVREHEQQFPHPERSQAMIDAGEGFYRRGVVGGYRDELTRAQIHRVERDHGAMMERLGYPVGPTCRHCAAPTSDHKYTRCRDCARLGRDA